MTLNNLVKTVDKPKKRVGRGLASGKGKTATRGTKGQKSRSGYNIPRRFEGGQTTKIQRLPKVRGFHSRFPKPLTITLTKIEERYNDGETVSFKTLIEKGLIKNADLPVKIIGGTKFTKKITYRNVCFSEKLAAVYAETKGEKAVEEVAKPAKVAKVKAEKVVKPAKTKKVAK